MTFHKYLNAIFAFLIAICFALCLVGCKSKKVTTESRSRSDTLITKSFDYLSKPIETNYEIQLECDTVTGEVKPVSQKQTSGSNSASLSIANNKLKAKLYTGESKIKSDTVYIAKKEKETSSSKEVIYRTPFKTYVIIAILGLSTLILLILQFKRYIPFI